MRKRGKKSRSWNMNYVNCCYSWRDLAAQREAREAEEGREERRMKIEVEERERRMKIKVQKLVAEERERGKRYELRTQEIEVIETEIDVTEQTRFSQRQQ